MKKIIALAIAGITLAGCAGGEESQINEAKARIRFLSSDPGTVQFNSVKVGQVQGEAKVCGYTNLQLSGQDQMTGAVPFIVGREQDDYWVETLGGDCEFDVLFKPCHDGADPAPLRQQCDAQIAQHQAVMAEYDAKRAALLVCHGLTTKGDTSRDHDQIIAAITAGKYGQGLGPNSPECQT